jgi:hypothetical protein
VVLEIEPRRKPLYHYTATHPALHQRFCGGGGGGDCGLYTRKKILHYTKLLNVKQAMKMFWIARKDKVSTTLLCTVS